VLNGYCPKCIAASLLADLQLTEDAIDQESPPSSEPTGEGDGCDVSLEASRFEAFQIQGEIGEGGMGRVFEALDTQLNRIVAIKRLKPKRETNQEARARFRTEARIASRLEHPGIVPIYSVGRDEEGRFFYTMRRIRGVTLAAIIEGLRRGAPETLSYWSLSRLLVAFEKICEAVAYAHSQRVIHRDLKPANIMIGEFGEVIVMDWGLAKEMGSDGTSHGEHPGAASREDAEVNIDAKLTSADTVMGSFGFMAPEQAAGLSQKTDERTDVFALGAILYCLLTLRPPILGKDTRLTLKRTQENDIRPPSDYNPQGWFADRRIHGLILAHCPDRRVPLALSEVCMRALARFPQDRYQTVGELRSEVTEYQAGRVTVAERAGLNRLLRLWVRRHRAISAFVVVLAFLVGGFTWKLGYTVTELRRTAPAFYSLAQSLLAEVRMEEALQKVEYALTLDRHSPEYLLMRAQLLQSQLRIRDARDTFAQVLRHQPQNESARENLGLCNELLESSSRTGALSPAELMRVYEALLQQKRGSEALALAPKLSGTKDAALRLWRVKLERAGIQGKLTRNTDVTLNLSIPASSAKDFAPLTGMPLRRLDFEKHPELTDIRFVKGMPLESLSLNSSGVKDLSPLIGSKLRDLNIGFTAVRSLAPLSKIPTLRVLALNNTGIADLAPLRDLQLSLLSIGSTRVATLTDLAGIPLTTLYIGHTRITNLNPVVRMPLQRLEMNHTEIADISPLRGLPLRHLYLNDCHMLTDLTPLATCRTLETLTLPPRHGDIEFLRSFPALKAIGYGGVQLPVAEFWRAQGARKGNKT